jgi:threonine synthase
LKAASLGKVRADETVVCILTGHGLKDVSPVGPGLETKIRRIDFSDITAELIESETAGWVKRSDLF